MSADHVFVGQVDRRQDVAREVDLAALRGGTEHDVGKGSDNPAAAGHRWQWFSWR